MASPTTHSPGEVLLVYNSKSPVSTAIANYYAAKRGVIHVLGVSCQDSALNNANETIPLADYTSEIETPIRAYLSRHRGINFIVLTKGIPIRIDGAMTGSEDEGKSPQDYRPSLDSYLAALDYSTAKGDVKAAIVGSGAQGTAWVNKYYNSTVPFTHAAFGGYLVTRLDAFTQADAMALVDRSLAAMQNPVKGPILLDVDAQDGPGDKTTMPPATPSTNVTKEESYDHGNADFLHAAEILEASGISCDAVITRTFAGDKSRLLGYFSWGSNDSNYPRNNANYESLSFAPGAIANTYVSSSLYTFIGQYAGFNGIDLTGVTTMRARVATANTGGYCYIFEIRLDSPTGRVIGICSVPETGGWQNWTTVTCRLTAPVSGVHNVYLAFIPNGYGGSLYNIEWIAFGEGPNVIKASSYSTLSGDASLEACSEGGQDLANIPNGQSHMTNLIANGLTGAEGYVGEPLLDGVVGITFNISHYEAGYTLAESFYAGTPYLGWEGIVVGDPLCAPHSGAMPPVTPTEASEYDGSGGGLSTEDCSEGGRDVGSIVNGSYTFYNGMNLTDDRTFRARVASAGSGGNIEIHLDGPTGRLIGTCAVPVTGDWQRWTTVSCRLSGARGMHRVCLLYTGGGSNLFDLEWFAMGK
ncbi:MAG: TIGR03790 family protein [Chthoniobacteraceae bacterium]